MKSLKAHFKIFYVCLCEVWGWFLKFWDTSCPSWRLHEVFLLFLWLLGVFFSFWWLYMYFSYIGGFEGIFVIFWGFMFILFILKSLEEFWSFYRFESILISLEVLRVFWSFWRFKCCFYHSKGFKGISIILKDSLCILEAFSYSLCFHL